MVNYISGLPVGISSVPGGSDGDPFGGLSAENGQFALPSVTGLDGSFQGASLTGPSSSDVVHAYFQPPQKLAPVTQIGKTPIPGTPWVKATYSGGAPSKLFSADGRPGPDLSTVDSYISALAKLGSVSAVDPTAILPDGVKRTPVAGMPGYTENYFPTGGHVVIGPGQGGGAVYGSVPDAVNRHGLVPYPPPVAARNPPPYQGMTALTYPNPYMSNERFIGPDGQTIGGGRYAINSAINPLSPGGIIGSLGNDPAAAPGMRAPTTNPVSRAMGSLMTGVETGSEVASNWLANQWGNAQDIAGPNSLFIQAARHQDSADHNNYLASVTTNPAVVGHFKQLAQQEQQTANDLSDRHRLLLAGMVPGATAISDVATGRVDPTRDIGDAAGAVFTLLSGGIGAGLGREGLVGGEGLRPPGAQSWGDQISQRMPWEVPWAPSPDPPYPVTRPAPVQTGAVYIGGPGTAAAPMSLGSTGRQATLAEWLADRPDLLDKMRTMYNEKPEWQGINPDETQVYYRPGFDVAAIRRMRGESGGHHPHGLALGGPTGQDLTITGDTRNWVNPEHSAVTGLQRQVINVIKNKT